MSPAQRRAALVILAGAAVLFLLRPSARTYTNRDVSRYAQMAFEMRHDRTLVPLLHHVPYHEATPLTAWAPLLVANLEGEVEPLCARLLPALAALATIGITLLLGARHSSGRAALFAAGIATLNYLAATYARQSRIDTVWALGTAGAVGAFFHGVERERWRWFAVSGVALAIAVAAKGPAAAAVVIAALGPYVLARQRWRLSFGGGAIAVAVALLLTLAWFLPYKQYLGEREFNAFIDQFWRRETVEKAESGYEKPHWPGFYVLRLTYHMLPWIPAVWIGVWRVIRQPRAATPLAVLAVSWSLAPLLMFEIAAGKQMRYMLPLVPGFAFLAAWELERWATSPDERAREWLGSVIRGAGACAVFVGLLAPIALVLHGRILDFVARSLPLETPVREIDRVLSFDPYAFGTAGAVVGGGILALVLSGKDVRRALLALFVSGVGVITFFYAAVLPLPYAERASSPYYVLAHEVEAALPTPTTALAVEDTRPAMDRSTIDDAALGLQLGRWVERSKCGQAPRESAVLAREELPGRAVLRVLAWRSHSSDNGAERWVLLGPAR